MHKNWNPVRAIANMLNRVYGAEVATAGICKHSGLPARGEQAECSCGATVDIVEGRMVAHVAEREDHRRGMG